MRHKFLLLSLISSLLLSGCGQQAASVPSPTATSGTAGSAITIQNFAFSPNHLEVAKGSTVTWKNQDTAVHSIVSATFASRTLHNGETFSFTFDQPGTYAYSCGIHPAMQGTVVVK